MYITCKNDEVYNVCNKIILITMYKCIKIFIVICPDCLTYFQFPKTYTNNCNKILVLMYLFEFLPVTFDRSDSLYSKCLTIWFTFKNFLFIKIYPLPIDKNLYSSVPLPYNRLNIIIKRKTLQLIFHECQWQKIIYKIVSNSKWPIL